MIEPCDAGYDSRISGNELLIIQHYTSFEYDSAIIILNQISFVRTLSLIKYLLRKNVMYCPIKHIYTG